MSRRATRRSASRRRARAPRGGGAGRFLRGVIEFLLIVVLLAFAASLLGLLDHDGQQAAQPREQEWDPRRTEVVPAVVEGFEEAGLLSGDGLEELARKRPEAFGEPAIRLHIANGCGVSKLASRARDALRAAGFDVRSVSNADTLGYRETIVVDRSGDRRAGDACLSFLRARWGVGRLVRQERPAEPVDVLVILGADVAERIAGEPPTP